MENFYDALSKPLRSLVELFGLSESYYMLGAALVGVVLIGAAFLLTLIGRLGAKLRKFYKQLGEANLFISDAGYFDEENIDSLNDHILTLPVSIKRGWGNFYQQRRSYPSDYITEKDVYADKGIGAKYKPGSNFFKGLGLIIAFLTFLIGASGAASSEFIKALLAGPFHFSQSVEFVIGLLAVLFLPITLYVILANLVSLLNKKLLKKALRAFLDFQDLLDERVLITSPEEEMLAAQKAQRAQAQFAKVMNTGPDKAAMYEVVSAPKSQDAEKADAANAQRRADTEFSSDEIDTSLVPQMSAEEEAQYFQQLLVLVDAALADPEVSKEDLEELAVLIATAKVTSFRNQEEQDILEKCLYKLADIYH
jgi:hypothetical protein